MKLTRTHYIGVAILAVCIVIVGSILYLRWTKSPSYSLLQVRSAIEAHDLTKFEKYVDLDSTISHFVDQLISKSMAKQQAESGGNEFANSLAQSFIQLMKPKLDSMIEEKIKQFVEKGSGTGSELDAGDTSINLANFFSKDGILPQGIVSTKTDGKITIVTLGFFQPQTKSVLILDVSMRQMDGYWQVAELPNAYSFIDQMNSIATKKSSGKGAS